MSGNQQSSLARQVHGVLSRIVPDRRRHKRVAVRMLGRFMRANKQEYPCHLQDISVGGAAILAPVTPEIRELRTPANGEPERKKVAAAHHPR